MKTPGKKTSSEGLRKKAEGLIKNKQSGTNPQLSEADTLKLLHELQVHQIELELQNKELILAKEQAEQVSEKYTDLYDFAPTGYFTLTQDAEIIELNLAGAKMLGKERSLLLNSNFVLFVSENSKIVFTNFIEKIFKSFKAESCEVTLLLNDNLQSYIYLTGIAKENENHCFVTVIDITPRKRLEIDLLKAKEKAEESDRLKTAFLQNMSHEIRTPMNAIKGFSGLLVKNYNNKPKLQKFTGIIGQRCDDLLQIINDILDIAKIESDQLSVNLEECDLVELFDELTTQFIEYQQRLEKQHIEFRLQTNCLASGSKIITDKVKLKQVLVNLLTNAFKFTDEGTIEGGCELNNDKLMFYVSDTGIGIPADKQTAIFERFTQLLQGKNHAVGGTGLGLTIIKGLVSLLGGEIFLESEHGKGSKFSFTIPLKLKHTLQKATEIIKENESFHFTGKTILIVEDEKYNVEYIKEILIDTDINILIAKTAKEAIQIASEQSIDLVLMDIRLPDLDGYKASQQIRKYKPKLKIIAQTAYAANSDRQEAFSEGLTDYISKPIKSKMLLSMLNKHLL